MTLSVEHRVLKYPQHMLQWLRLIP